MSLFQFILTYLVCWWLVLFTTLPLWVKTPEKPGAGHVPSAPERPLLLRKFALTTLLTLILTLLVMVLMNKHVLSLGEAHATSGIYHAGNGKCPPAGTASVNATDGTDAHGNAVAPATMNDSAFNHEIAKSPVLLEQPAGNYLGNSAAKNLRDSDIAVGAAGVNEKGQATLNGQPINTSGTSDCNH